ncbi:MAG TPA: FtsX-like permease family protein [Trueperaceae bacterium]|nr:FtsX-like permease family protein [Trueperaceae bacterium]
MLPRLALRNLLRHRWRSLATVLGVGIGVAAVLTTLSVGANVEGNVRSALQAAAGKADLLVTPGPSGRAVFEDGPALRAVRATPGVKAAYPVLNTRAEPVRNLENYQRSIIPGVDTGFQLSGRVTSVPSDVPARMAEGSLPASGSHGVAIAQGFANERGIHVGDTVKFATSFGDVPLKVTGLLDDRFGVASTNGGRVGIIDIEDLRQILHLSGRASHIEVMVDPSVPVEDVRTRLEARLSSLPESLTVTYPAVSGNVASGIVDTLQSGLSVLAVTLLALGGFMAYNTFMASVVERTREYALLRTICMTRGDVRRLALYESAGLSVAGAVVGLVLGVGLAYVITRLNAVSLGFDFRTLIIPGRNVAIACGVGIAVSLAAGVLPARNASRTPPLAAARSADEVSKPRLVTLGWALLVLGAGLSLIPWAGYLALAAAGVAMAVFFLGVTLATPSLLRPALAALTPLLVRVFGAAGRLGSNFALRNASRNGVAIGTVAVGAGLIIGVGSMVAGINQAIASWVNTTVVGDLFVTSPVGFPADFETQAQKLPGVKVASGVGIRVVRFEPKDAARGRSIALILVDPQRFDPNGGFGRFQYIQGQGNNREGYEALKHGGEVLVANTMRDKYGIQKGDTIRLRTNEGFRDFPVAGVVVDFTGGGETVVGSIHDANLFGGGSPDLYVIADKAGADSKQVRDELLTAFPNLHLDVTLNADYRRYILSLTQRTFVTTNTLLLIAVLVAALGVANALGMNLVSRSHEIAVLRTVGMTRAGVRRLIAAEGMVVTLVGALLGVAFGLLLGRVIVAGGSALTGFLLTPVVNWPLVALALVASPVVGFIASLLPARRAAQLSPTRALGFTE